MESKMSRSLMTLVLVLTMLLISSVTVNAVSETGRDADEELTEGVWESTVYVTESNGRNIRAHILKINNGSNVTLKASTPNYYTDKSTAKSRAEIAETWEVDAWGYETINNQASAYESSKDSIGMVIAGINGDLYNKDKNGETHGKLVVEGNVINPSTAEPFFAVLKDGSFDIRDANETTSDVSEAIAGPFWLVQNGKVVDVQTDYADTITAIGVTADNDVVVALVDGREPSSKGTCGYDVGMLLNQQGCEEAIMLDCGGSASFLTKRKSDEELVFRNTPNDGIPRPVSSALLVVKNDKGDSAENVNEPAVSMANSDTYLDTDSDKLRYYIEGTAQTGLQRVNDQQLLFDDEGNGATEDITIGQTTYSFVNGKLEKCDDPQTGRITIGYCGADAEGKDVLYAYHYDDNKLNIGINPHADSAGLMKDWDNIIDVPWQTEKHRIKRVVIGEGVKNIGDNFLKFPKHPFNEDLKKINPALSVIVMPSSLTTIGKGAFFNQTGLKMVIIPESVNEIRTGAFQYDSDTVFVFKGDNTPQFEKLSFKSGKENNNWFIVQNSESWKAFADDNAAKEKCSFGGQVKISE